MRRIAPLMFGCFVAATFVSAQAPQDALDLALAAAPRQMRDGAMVIKWKADQTYDTLRPGTNRLVCYDQSGEPSEQPISALATLYTGTAAWPAASKVAHTFSLMKSTPSTMMARAPRSAICTARSAICSESATWMCGELQADSVPCNSASI